MMDRVDRALRRIAAETARVEPPQLERVLLAEFDRVHRRGTAAYWAIAAGLAAVLMGAGWLIEQQRAPKPEPPQVAESAEQPFVAIPYVAPLAPYERADVVRIAMPVAALLAAGLSVPGADAGATAETDVVVGQDGRAHAVRVVSISD